MSTQVMTILEDLCVRSCLAAYEVVRATGVRDQVAEDAHEVDHGDEVLGIDRSAGNAILDVLSRADVTMDVVLEEKMDPIHLHGRDLGRTTAFVDPFDGSKLFKRGLRAFWASAIGFICDESPVASGIIDHVEGTLYSSDGRRVSARALLSHRVTELTHPVARAEVTAADVAEWYVESYAMTPAYFSRAHEVLGPLIRSIRCFVPNGGPTGFVDVLTGKVDVYIGLAEAVTEVMPSLALAEAGSLNLSFLDGNAFQLRGLERTSRVDFVCARSRAVVDAALKLISGG